ncbi:helix-turn-helix domain-containing protein [Mitsuokella multacida]|uniref:helix-turn-helix domain-containing protein n=1 Tax=Mitsuokella multacida TaxID=52226 RepID=UPI0039F46EAF
MSFGDNIKHLREEQGLTRQGLAAISGISSAAIGYYESGKREPQASTLVSIARALHVTTDSLLGYSVPVVGEYEKYKALLESYGCDVDEDTPEKGNITVQFNEMDSDGRLCLFRGTAIFCSRSSFCRRIRDVEQHERQLSEKQLNERIRWGILGYLGAVADFGPAE